MDNSRKGSSDRNQGYNPRSNDNRRGDDPRGNESRGNDRRGDDPRGNDPRGNDPRGNDRRNDDRRSDYRGRNTDQAGGARNNYNNDRRGDDPRGNDRRGDDPRGNDRRYDGPPRGNGPRPDRREGGYGNQGGPREGGPRGDDRRSNDPRSNDRRNNSSDRPYSPNRNRPEGGQPGGGYNRDQRPNGPGRPYGNNRPGGANSGGGYGQNRPNGARPASNPNRSGFDQARQAPFVDPDDSKAWQKRDEEGRQYGDVEKPARRERKPVKAKKGPSPRKYDEGGDFGKGRTSGGAKPRRDRTEKYGKARGWQDFSDEDGRAKPGQQKNTPEKRREGRPGGRPERTTEGSQRGKGVPQYKSMAQPPSYDFLKKKSRESKEKPAAESNEIRLNRYIAKAGITSRREADELIAQGLVKVNGQVVTELGTKVQRTDTVTYEGKKLNPERLVYVLLNKPKDFITTTEDPEDRKTVMDLVANACEERIYPVGRLDRNTTGLLLLTNDGELAKKLSHPSHQIKKVYHVLLDRPLTPEDYEAIDQGLELEDGVAKVDDLAVLSPDRTAVGLEIHIGRNRIVRRIFEHLGYSVERLDRVTFAGLTKKDLDRGRWRYLTEKEVIRLKHFN